MLVGKSKHPCVESYKFRGLTTDVQTTPAQFLVSQPPMSYTAGGTSSSRSSGCLTALNGQVQDAPSSQDTRRDHAKLYAERYSEIWPSSSRPNSRLRMVKTGINQYCLHKVYNTGKPYLKRRSTAKHDDSRKNCSNAHYRSLLPPETGGNSLVCVKHEAPF